MKRFMTAVALMGAVALAPRVVQAQGMAMEGKDIVETAVAAGTFNTLARALTVAGLVETLKGAGPFTVFAPTDAAFAKLPPAALAALLADKAKLTAVLTYHVVPGAVMAAQVVGLTEAEAIEAGHPCWCNTLPMSLVPRAGAIRDTKGIIKMVADAKTNEVLGVTMIGNSAGEVIHEAMMALRFRAKLQDFIEQLHVYPTMAEALKIAAISRYKDPSKLSCCAE